MRHLRSHLLPLLLWTALVGVLYGPLVIGAQALPASDLTGQFYPFAVFQHRELAAGRLPVWSPGSFGGFPFAADVQAATFYPPRLLLLRLSPATPLPVHLLEIEGLLHLWLAGAGLYALTVHITARREAGLIAATTFGLGGYLTGYPLLQLAILETIAWLPLALLLIRQAARVERPALAGRQRPRWPAAHWRPSPDVAPWRLCRGCLTISTSPAVRAGPGSGRAAPWWR